jgi:L-ascorbate metabolism protein UlaG (beta-lactamase superfamily)
LKINDCILYHAGDTDIIPEMSNLKNINVAFLPIGGSFTMDSKETVDAVSIIKPEFVIPIHLKKKGNPNEFH